MVMVMGTGRIGEHRWVNETTLEYTEASMTTSEAKDWREAYPVGSECEIYAREYTRTRDGGWRDGPKKWQRGTVHPAASGYSKLTVCVDGWYWAVSKCDARPLAPPAAKREPRDGDRWQAACGDKPITVFRDMLGVWRNQDGGNALTNFPDGSYRGGPLWTLVTPAPEPSGQVTVNVRTALSAGEHKAASKAAFSAANAMLDTATEYIRQATSPASCPHCAHALTKAHTVAVWRCAECHWTGGAEALKRAGEPERSEPRFRVGQMVARPTGDGYGAYPAQVMAMHFENGAWWYEVVKTYLMPPFDESDMHDDWNESDLTDAEGV